MKMLKQLMYLLAFTLLLAACKGDDGDPGPQGDAGAKGDTGAQGEKGDKGDVAGFFIKSGSIEGTIEGTRKDGTAINEKFKYEYWSTEQIEGFNQDGDISFTRFEKEIGGSFLSLNFSSTTGTTLTADKIQGLEFEFYKELSTNQLFKLATEAEFEDRLGFKLEINEDDNNTYGFSHGSNPNNNGIYYQPTTYNATAVYAFDAYYNNEFIDIYYKQSDGRLLSIKGEDNIDRTSGSVFDLYNQIKLVNNATLSIPTFYTVADNRSLALNVPNVPADEFTITNYAMNQSTGVVTFDFVLKVSGYREYFNGTNTTYHDLKVTGKFNSGGKVYSSIVGRKG